VGCSLVEDDQGFILLDFRTKRRFITAFLSLNIVVHVSSVFLLLAIVITTSTVQLGFSYASAILVFRFRTSTTSAMMASKCGELFSLCPTEILPFHSLFYFPSRVGAITCSATDIMIATALLSTFIRIEAETGLEKK
jgi:hypothetical protein